MKNLKIETLNNSKMGKIAEFQNWKFKEFGNCNVEIFKNL